MICFTFAPPLVWAAGPELILLDSAGTPRATFWRGETIVIQTNAATASPARKQLVVRDDADAVCCEVALKPGKTARIEIGRWRAGAYTIRLSDAAGGTAAPTTARFAIAPPLRDPGIMLGMLEEQKRSGPALASNLQFLAERGISGVMHYQIDRALMEAAPEYGMRAMAIVHGACDPRIMKDRPPLIRLNAAGNPFKDKPPSIADLAWQDGMAAGLAKTVSNLAKYPCFLPWMCTSDDFYRRTGLDYHPINTERFKTLTGHEPPRPPEALTNDYPRNVARSPGIIPDDDPWVAWLRFNSRDVLGRFNRGLAVAVEKATGGAGRIGPVPGGGPLCMGTVPLVDMESGQWPPYNFGVAGFNLVSYYNYNFNAYPALIQVWWAEAARMGNRDMPVWLMPDTMHPRTYYHLQNWHLFMSAHLDGLVYFIHEWSKPGFDAALRNFGPIMENLGPWLKELEQVPANIGLLLPFEAACYRADYPIECGLAYCNLRMAHVPVEPVSPEELAERGGRYRAVLLHDVDYLSESNARLLEKYRQKGGRVIADRATGLDLPWAERLDFALREGSRETCYGDTNLIGKIARALGPVGAAWAECDDPFTLITHFQSGEAHYLWLVDLQDHDADAANIPPPGQGNTPALPDAYSDEKIAALPPRARRISVPPGAWVVHDIFAHTNPQQKAADDGRIEIEATVGRWNGTLLALYPHDPTELKIDATGSQKRGRDIDMALEVRDKDGKRIKAAFPLKIDVFGPDKKALPEYSHAACAVGGRYRFTIPLAENDPIGTWKIEVRETSSGLRAVVASQVR